MGLLDLIFPKYCVNCKKWGEYLCSNCFSLLSFDTKNICAECSLPAFSGITHPKCRTKYSLEGTFTALVFNKTVKKLIYQFKYKPNLTDLRKTLSDLLYESLIQREEFARVFEKEKSNIFLVPIPLSSEKLKKRGYNQSEILAKDLGKKLGLPYINLLRRIKDTKSQVGLDKKERRENIKNAFALKGEFDLKNKEVFLVDDVMTTGATLSEAGKILKKAGISKVWGLALAKED